VFFKVNDTCYNCLKMFREKVRAKCDEAKVYRNQGTPSSTVYGSPGGSNHTAAITGTPSRECSS
jgi:hypothetical protein